MPDTSCSHCGAPLTVGWDGFVDADGEAKCEDAPAGYHEPGEDD